MTLAPDSIRKLLNVLILIALGIGCIGSVLFVVFRDYLVRYPTCNF